MVVGIDRSLLGKPLESVVGVDRGIDRDELESEGSKELVPGWRVNSPVLSLMIKSPPKGSLVFEKCHHKHDVIILWNWCKLAVLFHLKNPGFQRFILATSKWGWSFRFDVRDLSQNGSWGWD